VVGGCGRMSWIGADLGASVGRPGSDCLAALVMSHMFVDIGKHGDMALSFVGVDSIAT
jgi:hypothetical protein